MFYLFDVTSTKKNYGSLMHHDDDNINNVGHHGEKKTLDKEEDDDNDDDDEQLAFFRQHGGHHNNNITDDDVVLLDIDEAIQRIGFGSVQYCTILATGFLLVADAMEIVLLSYLSHVAEQTWGNYNDNDSSIDINNSDANAAYADADADDDGSDTLLRTVVFPAALAGAIVWGVLADWYGRRIVLVATSGVVAVFGILTSFVTTYDMLIITRCLVSFGIGGMTVGFDLCAELVPPNKRGKILAMIQGFWIVGSLVAHLTLKYQNDNTFDYDYDNNDSNLSWYTGWRWISCIFAVPSVIALLVTLFVVPDSPRWYLSKGRHDDALSVLRQAAAINQKDPTILFPPNIMLFSHEYTQRYHYHYVDVYNDNDNQNDSQDENDHDDGGDRHDDHHDDHPSSSMLRFTDIGVGRCWSSSSFIHTIISKTRSLGQIFYLCSDSWMSITAALWTTYFGKAFLEHGTVSMAVNVFSNDDRQQEYQALFTATSEIVGLGLVMATIDRYGRSTTQCACYAMSGLLCLILSLFEDYSPFTNPNLLLGLVFLAHLFVHSGTITTWIATAEVLATTIRTTGHGTSHAMTRIGGAFSTYVLARIYSTPTVGLILFVTALWTASAASKLPETVVKDMGAAHYPEESPRRRRRRRQRHRRHDQRRRSSAHRQTNHTTNDTIIVS